MDALCSRRLVLPALLLLGAALACAAPGQSDDSGGVATSLAQTAAAILTQTAGAPTPSTGSGQTPAPIETTAAPSPVTSIPQLPFTPTSIFQAPATLVLANTATSVPQPSECEKDDSDFVTDITVPDGTEVAPNTVFVKTWRLRNSGNCTWGAGYLFVHISGPNMGAPASVALPAVVQPGEEINISVNFTAPSTPGEYRSRWQLQQPDGARIGTRPYVEIIVKE